MTTLEAIARAIDPSFWKMFDAEANGDYESGGEPARLVAPEKQKVASLNAARAAVSAMREPSETMINILRMGTEVDGFEHSDEKLIRIYHALVDAILEEKE